MPNLQVSIDEENTTTEVLLGQLIEVTADIENTGSNDDMQTIYLDLGDDDEVDEEEITVEAGETKTVELEAVLSDKTGSYAAQVNSDDDSAAIMIEAYEISKIVAPDEVTDTEEDIEIIVEVAQAEETTSITDVKDVHEGAEEVDVTVEFSIILEDENVFVDVIDDVGDSLAEEAVEVPNSGDTVTVNMTDPIEQDEIHVLAYETEKLERELDSQTVEVLE